VPQERADASPRRLYGSLGGLAPECLEHCDDLLDRIEIGAIGRQEEALGPSGSNGAAPLSAKKSGRQQTFRPSF